MRLKGILLIPRLDGFFELKDSVVFRSYGFRGFPVDRVQAAYRRDNPVDGYGVALILEPSQVDQDFQAYTFFLAEDSAQKIQQAFRKSDELTHQRLNRGWTGGPRPFLKVVDFM